MEKNNNKIQNATAQSKVQKDTYSKRYYIMFFTIMIVSFLFIFWICNYTKLRELFQIITLMALSIAIAEYTTRRFL